MIEINSLCYAYPNCTENVLQDINISIKDGEVLTILGANGSGKSTLLKLIRGALKPSQGSVNLKSESTHKISRQKMAKHIAVVPQHLPRTFSYPVREIVAMGRFAKSSLLGKHDKKDIDAVNNALQQTDTDELANRSIMQISGGELQRVLLARALAQETPMLLLDEAASHLDLRHRLDMLHLLKNLNKQKQTTIVQVSHDFDLSAEISDRILLLSPNGKMITIDTPKKVLTKENIKLAFDVDVQIQNNDQTNAPRVLPVIKF